MKYSSRFLLASAFALSLFLAKASADSLTLTLLDANQIGAPGSTLSFYATIAAPDTNLGEILLNGDSLTADFPLTTDDSGFWFEFPFSLNPGESFTGHLFDVTIPDFTASGLTLGGFFQILGGADGGAQDLLATEGFSVQTAAAAVPESFSNSLLVAVLAGMVALSRRRSFLRQA